MKREKITTIEQLKDRFKEVYYLEDDRVINVLIACMCDINVKGTDALWMMLVGGSSSGKSELVNTLLGVKGVHQVSQLTENTFLSGAVRRGSDTSLLLQIGTRGTMIMKDFTSILSLQNEKQANIMGQLREIYDGHFVKHTGMGDKLEWGPNAKLNLIAACTEEIHVVAAKFSSMGTRMLYYTLPEQDRIKTTLRAFDNQGKMEEMRKSLQRDVNEYLTYIRTEKLGKGSKVPEIPKDLRDEIIQLTDFASMARSAVKRDYHGEMELVLSPEMPMRIAAQVFSLGSMLMVQYDGEATQIVRDILYKVCLDSIPKQRKTAMKVLAKYKTATTSGVAKEMNYPTRTILNWLEDLNVLGLVKRKVGDGSSYTWEMEKRFKEIVCKYENVTPVEVDLDAEDEFTEAKTSSYSGANSGFYNQVPYKDGDDEGVDCANEEFRNM